MENGTKFIKPNGVILIVDKVVGNAIHFHEQNYLDHRVANKRIFDSMCSLLEFEIGDTVTLDRYNHIDDVESVEVVGYGSMPMSGRLTYKMSVKGTIIESTGGSIMESKNYKPVPADERHCKKAITVLEAKIKWNEMLAKSKN